MYASECPSGRGLPQWRPMHGLGCRWTRPVPRPAPDHLGRQPRRRAISMPGSPARRASCTSGPVCRSIRPRFCKLLWWRQPRPGVLRRHPPMGRYRGGAVRFAGGDTLIDLVPPPPVLRHHRSPLGSEACNSPHGWTACPWCRPFTWLLGYLLGWPADQRPAA